MFLEVRTKSSSQHVAAMPDEVVDIVDRFMEPGWVFCSTRDVHVVSKRIHSTFGVDARSLHRGDLEAVARGARAWLEFWSVVAGADGHVVDPGLRWAAAGRFASTDPPIVALDVVLVSFAAEILVTLSHEYPAFGPLMLRGSETPEML